MDRFIECTSVADYNSTIENTIVYYVWNNMYDLEHCINHEYINDDPEHCINHEYINDDPITVQQYDNIMRFLDEIS